MPQLPPIDNFGRLIDNIHDELVVKNIMLNLDLNDQTLKILAEDVAINIDYAFDVRWSPDWVRKGDPHAWHEETDSILNHFAECVTCGAVFAEQTSNEAQAAYRLHASEQHGSAPGSPRS